jgi:exosortase
MGLALGVVLLVAANLGYVFGGRGVRHFGFPFIFLLIALPMPSVLHNLVVGGLQSKITVLNVELLNVIGIPAQQVGSLIRLPGCVVGVDEACSGIRSLQSTVMATLFIGHLTLGRLGLRVVLLGLGIALAVVGNLGRSFFLSYTANAKGPAALESVHDTAGWSILLFTAAGVASLAWLLSRLEKPPVGPTTTNSAPKPVARAPQAGI